MNKSFVILKVEERRTKDEKTRFGLERAEAT